ncbi:unnamed protein product [Bursaphelenchus okinawaensis]|uniref:Peptidase A1 domain-containing protein n=1 Tax=Bursaphelenchus okinawaensis TaxID=465554 RepID=A0A811L604_9BILA|nr:unnamed protein product [Bursaphelenchus okinawaensis]CAG9117302.1 unnamed protein product [Bursaphelenchus okinawaensis]
MSSSTLLTFLLFFSKYCTLTTSKPQRTFYTIDLDYRNGNYTTTVSVGTPGQAIEAVFSTTTKESIIPIFGCVNTNKIENCKTKKNVFDSKKSTSFKSTKGRFSNTFSGVEVKGNYGQDVVELTYSNTPPTGPTHPIRFKTATSTNVAQGIIALPLISTKKFVEQSSLIHNVINGSSAEALFSVFMKKCDKAECSKSGRVTIGYKDTENCQDQVAWYKLRPSARWSWKVSADAVKVNGDVIKKKVTTGFDIMLDVIEMPRKLLKAFLDKIEYGEDKNGYTVPCDTKLNLEIQLKDDLYPIPQANLIKREGNICRLLVRKVSGHKFILGRPWAISYCQTFDINGRDYGISDVKAVTNSNNQKKKNTNKAKKDDKEEKEDKNDDTPRRINPSGKNLDKMGF